MGEAEQSPPRTNPWPIVKGTRGFSRNSRGSWTPSKALIGRADIFRPATGGERLPRSDRRRS